MENNETIADIIAEMRALSNPISDGIIAINGRSIADRLEAAWKREKSAIEADALAVGGIVEASRSTAEKSSTVGDCAKLREALVMVRNLIIKGAHEDGIFAVIDRALAAPARNCDKYSHDEALRIWSAEPENPMNGCFDVWLYAPATEQKGEGDEQK